MLLLRHEVGGHGDNTLSPEGKNRHHLVVVAGIYVEISISSDLGSEGHIAACFLSCNYIRNLRKLLVGVNGDVAAGTAGNVVKDYRYLHAVCDSGEVLYQSALGSLVVVRRYLKQGVRAEQLFYGICALLGMMGSLASDSDMAVAGMFFAFVILIYFAISDYNRLIRYFMLAVELFIAGRILGVIYIFNQFNTRIIKSVGSIIVYKNVFVVFPVVCFIAIFIIQLLHDKYDLFANKKLIDKIKKIYVIICVVFAAAACLMVIICTAVQRGPLAITDDWGSGRGYIWKNLLDGFKNLPFINKIFGAGEASTAWVLSDYSAAANNIFNRGRVDNAHNIWINMLITLGIAGLIVYVLLLVAAISNIKRHLKGSSEACHMNKSRYMLAGAGLAVMVYSIQGTAEMLEVITFPIFFCLLAMLNCSTKNKNTEKQELNKKETDI